MHRTIAHRTWERNPEAGNTLVVVLLVLFLLTSLGISYVAVTKGDKQIAGNQMISSQAFENAEAGISEVLYRMSDPNAGTGIYLGEPVGSYTPGWGRYVVNDPGNSGLDPNYNSTAADGLDNDGDAAVDESSEHYIEKGSKQGLLAISNKLDYPWVKVRYKLNGANQIVLFGDHDNNPSTPPQENLVRGIPKIIVTAAGRRGAANKIVTVEAVKWPLPPVPGSIYTESPMSFAGNSFYIDGHDHDYLAPYDTIAGAPAVSGISTPNDPSVITGALGGQQEDNVQGAGSDPSVQSSPVNLDIQAIATAWSQMADITLVGDQSNPNTSGWGNVNAIPYPDLKIVHIAGDLDIQGNMSGAGVIIVDGDFKMGGTVNWNGLVIVLGDVDVVGGGNDKNIIGGLVVQGTVSGNMSVNGNVKTLYSSAMIAKLNALTKYEVSSWIDQ